MYERYKEKKREVNRRVREEKKKADKIRKCLLKEVKRVRKEESAREERVKDKIGKLLKESRAVRERWAEYFEELLNVNDYRVADIDETEGTSRGKTSMNGMDR